MSRRDKFFYARLALLFVLIASALIAFYTMKLREVLERNILLTVEETALHDKRAIKTTIELFLDELGGVQERIAHGGCDSIKELEKRLNLEGTSTSFTRLFMLAEDGRIFTDKFLIYKPGQDGIGGRFDFRHLFAGTARTELVQRFDDNVEFAGIARESILYARKLEDFSVAGLRMLALIGFTDIDFLQEHMIIDCFIKDGQPYGFSSIIDRNGNYIVGRTRDIYLRNDTSFFTQLGAAASCSLSKRDIVRNMEQHKSFSFYLEDANGKQLVYFVPFLNTRTGPELDWYFIMVVSNDFLEERQTTFSRMGLSLLGLVVLSLAVLMLYGVFSRNRLHMARESVRVRSEFLSSMSHEIRTPLNGIIGLNYLISSHVGEPGRLPRIREWLDKSRSLADYLLALLNDILDMSKLQAGKVDIVNQRFSVPAMVADVTFMQSANAEKRGVRLEVRQDVPVAFVLGDETRLKQVLVNIIGNAVKFTPSGGSITVSVSQERLDNDHVRTTYRCQDTGRGMSKAFLQQLFDPFSQEAAAQHGTARGTGLGMPITRELVLAMHGSIDVESEEGKGSTFIVSIPNVIAGDSAMADAGGAAAAVVDSAADSDGETAGVSAGDDAQGGPTAAMGRAEGAALPGAADPMAETAARTPVPAGKILLAEDAEFNAEFLIEVLQDEGFTVVHAQNGQAALDSFRASQPGEFSVILMDMQMPVMDGCDAARAIRALDRPDAATVVIYACTANTFREDMDRALASGMNDFLTKPIDIKVFLRKMAAISGGGRRSTGGGQP